MGANRARLGRCAAGERAVDDPDLNPDGVAADTRQNADRVDLSRNSPGTAGRWALPDPLLAVTVAGRRVHQSSEHVEHRSDEQERPSG